MGILARSSIVLACVFAPAVAFAQGAAPAPPSAAGAAAAPAPNGAAPAAEEPKAEEPKKATVPAAGYAYSDKPQRRAAAGPRVFRHAAAGPTATLPGFQELPDGGSRLFVQLTQSVPVQEQKAQGTITYVLKGAHVRLRNNTNALVTVHFNTPVSRARLVPRGNDLLFVVDLRANATPTYKIEDGKDKTATLTVDFAKGDFIPKDVQDAPEPSIAGDDNANGEEGENGEKNEAAPPPVKKTQHKKGRGKAPPPAPPPTPPADGPKP